MRTATRLYRRSTIAVAIASILLILIISVWASTALRTVPPSRLPLTIALPVQVASGALYIAQERQLFHKHALDVKLRPFLLGKQALQSVLDGQADLAFVADTPFALAVMRGEQIAALATVFESRKTMAIFTLKDGAITDAGSLAGKRVGTVTGTNAEYFLHTMLDVYDIPHEKVTITGFKPENLAAALVDGKVDAVTVWNPTLARLENEFGARSLTIYGEDFFVYRFLLVGKKNFIDKHPSEVSRILATLIESNDLIKADPVNSRNLVGHRLDMEQGLLARSFNANDFTLALDQPLLLALSSQKRWAETKQMVPVQDHLDFLDFLRPVPLTTLSPDANKMIR